MAIVTPLLIGAAIGASGAWVYVRQQQSQATEVEESTAEQPVVKSDTEPATEKQAVKPMTVADS